MRRFLVLVSIYFVFVIPVFCVEVFVDDLEVQEYKGYTGRWVEIASQSQLKYNIQKFKSSNYLVRKVNGTFNYQNEHVFIPYGENIAKKFSIKREKESTSANGFIWPIYHLKRITSAFGMRWGHLHAGVDMPAVRGTPVVAAMDGMVVQSGFSNGHGNTIYIEHRDNFYTRYSHNSVLLVKKGDIVKRGQVIGYVGSTGNSTGNHLHFEIRYKNIPLNPLDFLPVNKNIDKNKRYAGMGR